MYQSLDLHLSWSHMKDLFNLDMGAILSNEWSGRPKPFKRFDLLYLAALYLRKHQAGQGSKALV